MAAGCSKHSKKRDAILNFIKSVKSHPGAQKVYEELKPLIPDLSLATVYRNIKFFLETGALTSVGVVNGEERFDGIVEPHPHFICARCGRVEDLPCPFRGAPEPPAWIPEDRGLVIDYRKTLFSGLCGECLPKG